jgi:putative transcriptional regulator
MLLLRSLKVKNEEFDELIASIQEAGQIQRGEIEASRRYEFAEPNIQAIREKLGFSQAKFAELIGVNRRTLQLWEQGQHRPTGSAKVLLKLVQTAPEWVVQNLQANHA